MNVQHAVDVHSAPNRHVQRDRVLMFLVQRPQLRGQVLFLEAKHGFGARHHEDRVPLTHDRVHELRFPVTEQRRREFNEVIREVVDRDHLLPVLVEARHHRAFLRAQYVFLLPGERITRFQSPRGKDTKALVDRQNLLRIGGIVLPARCGR